MCGQGAGKKVGGREGDAASQVVRAKSGHVLEDMRCALVGRCVGVGVGVGGAWESFFRRRDGEGGVDGRERESRESWSDAVDRLSVGRDGLGHGCKGVDSNSPLHTGHS